MGFVTHCWILSGITWWFFTWYVPLDQAHWNCYKISSKYFNILFKTFVILHLNLPAVFHNKYEKHSREICYLSVVSGIMFFFLIFFHLYHLTFKNISGLSVSYFKCSFSWWWKWGDWVNGLREALNRTTDPSPVLRSTSLVSMKLSSSSASAMSWLLLFPYFRAVLSWERW